MEEMLQIIEGSILRGVQRFGYMDRAAMLDELAEWCRREADTALKMEYMTSECGPYEGEEDAYGWE